MTYTHASLFSGIGGAELAASWLGWTNVFHCEIQEFQRKVLEYWFPNSVSYEDITKTDFSEWRGHIDVLTGGFPYQPFSVAGKRKGAEQIAHKVGGGTSQLNPLFVTEMMGYPLEWLTLPFLSQSGEEKVLKR